jgi:hypothetical protein
MSTALIRHMHRGFYEDPTTGEHLRSVTTILSQGMSKEPLKFWAANHTAQIAMENLDFLTDSAGNARKEAVAYDWLRKAHIRAADTRADIGKAVHSLIEADILGEPIADGIVNDPNLAPYLRHFHQFVEDFEITFHASEMVVANYTHGYAGTLDCIFSSPHIGGGKPRVGDWKTGGELDVKGVYAEAGLQNAAYRNAEKAWLRDGRKVPMPKTYGGMVFHLRPEGIRPIPVRCDAVMFEAFLTAKQNARFITDTAKTVVGKPAHPGTDHVWDAELKCRYCGTPTNTVHGTEKEAA